MMTKAFYELVRTAPKGRWNGIQRNYGPNEVHRLRSGVQIEYTLAVSILVKFFHIFVKLDHGLNMLISSPAPNMK
jgi:isocitrate lyase